MDEKIEKLLTAMVEVVNGEGPWTAKRDLVKRIAKRDDTWDSALEEFVGWFPDEVS